MMLRARSQGRRAKLRRWIPQGVRDLLNRLGGYAIYYRGQYRDWSAACSAAGGYDEGKLLSRIEEAACTVAAGQAAWEQDGVTWDHVPIDLPLSAALGRTALARQGRLRVLDFGGGLGSSFLQCRAFFDEAIELSWGIVEQPALVEVGRRGIEREGLRFFTDIGTAIAEIRPAVALFSGVLQYLESPWDVLQEITESPVDYLVIDRHPCSMTRELITVQVVPPSLYSASYASWLFDCPRMLRRLGEHFELLAVWEGKDPAIRGWGMGAEFRGYFCKRHGAP